MKRLLAKMFVGVFAATTAVLLTAGVASAGGWAMTSLDTTPRPVAGKSQDVGFTIRQHGARPVNVSDGEVGINVRTASGGEEFFPASQQGQTGHYVSRVLIESPGATTWQVMQGWFGPQDLGRIDVARPTAATVGATEGTSGSTYRGSLVVRVLLPVLGIGLGAFALVDAITTRRRRSRDLITT